jgi:thiosulfate reductase cytochrome b subunit
VKTTQLTKLNPLQRLTYFGLKVLVIPLLVTTGFLWTFYNAWPALGLGGLSLGSIAGLHTLAAYVMVAFMIAHIYLTTTGHTPLSNLKAMITGWRQQRLDFETPKGRTRPPSGKPPGRSVPCARALCCIT